MSPFETRRNKLRRLVRKAGADALLVTNFTNVTYLTGFTGDDSYLLLTGTDQVILSDPRYTTQLEEECPAAELAIRAADVAMPQLVAKTVGRAKVQKLGIEAGSMSVDVYGQLGEKLTKSELVTTRGLVESLRMIKDREEIERIRQAAWQAGRGFEVIRASIRPEQTEREVAAELEREMRRFGATGCSFPPIVAVGARAALPHASPTDQTIGSAAFTLIDWGACEGQYVSDLTRLVVTAKISPKLQRVYGVVLKAQVAAIRAVKPGVTCGAVDAVARTIITKAGYGKTFGHGLGHGIGLDVHEAPRLARNQQTVLRPGMVVTVEPGIYLPGWGGVRIEDDVLVTRTGHEVLTPTAKHLESCVVDSAAG